MLNNINLYSMIVWCQTVGQNLPANQGNNSDPKQKSLSWIQTAKYARVMIEINPGYKRQNMQE